MTAHNLRAIAAGTAILMITSFAATAGALWLLSNPPDDANGFQMTAIAASVPVFGALFLIAIIGGIAIATMKPTDMPS